MGRRRAAYAALVALLLIVGGWALARTSTSGPAPNDPASPNSSAPTSTNRKPAPAGVQTCALATLPREATATVRTIHTGGPFPFPRNDGVVFGNREGHLPEQAKGYYHEFTVITPGAQNRSTRRIITGGTPSNDPSEYFYTGDHYDSFCLVVGAERR